MTSQDDCLEGCREARRQLFESWKHFIALSLAQNTALSVILDMPSEARKNLTRSQLWETVNQAMDNTRPIVAERTAELEQALSDDSRFLSALRNYLEQPESNVIFRS
jgi:hypothetical protein